MYNRMSRSIFMVITFFWFGAVAGQPVAAYADERPDLVIAVNKLAKGLEPARKTGNVDLSAAPFPAFRNGRNSSQR